MNRSQVRAMFALSAIGDQMFMPWETFTPDRIIVKNKGRVTGYTEPPYDHKWFRDVKEPRWTDDTQLSLAVAESLIACKGLDLADMARQHVLSIERDGNLGFGKSTLNSIARLRNGVNFMFSGEPNGAGNGVVMKIAPIGAYCAHQQSTYDRSLSASKYFRYLEDQIEGFALMTHISPLATDSAHVHTWIISSLLNSQLTFGTDEFTNTVRHLLNYLEQDERHDEWHDDHKLLEWLLALRHLPLQSMTVGDLRKLFGNGTCYVYNSLPFCYAFFLRNPHSIEALYDVGNAGGDTDTNAFIVGGMLGALNGMSIVPQHLLDGLWQKDRIMDTAERFCDTFGIKE